MSSGVSKSLPSNVLNNCYDHRRQSGSYRFLPARVTQISTQFSLVWPRVVHPAITLGQLSDGRRPSVSQSHLAGDEASFGAKEATIFSKRGSPRSGSQKGNSLSMPWLVGVPAPYVGA